MPYTFRRWSEEDIAKLKSMAQNYPTATIAAELGRSVPATVFKAHGLKVSLKVVRLKRPVTEPERVGEGSRHEEAAN